MTDPRAYVSRTVQFYDHPEQEGFDSLETTDGRFIDRHTLGLHTAEGHYLGRAWFFRDFTARRRAEAEALRLARFDVLTGLANRGVFVEALHLAIAREERVKTGFAVIALDLDHFKDVNDTLGHLVGDQLLRAVAERLRWNTREQDTVGRFGGDEFALVASDVTAPLVAAQLADKLIEAIGEPYTIDGNVIYCGASIGIDVYGPNANDAETLLSHADIALYRAKAEGRGSYRFFTSAMDADVRNRVVLAADLRAALDGDQLFLVYQPQVSVLTGRITGVEAIVRWRHPTRGVLDSDAFVPLAEDMGLIVKLGHWMLWTACRQSRIWRDAGMAAPRIAMNVSAVRFKAPHALEADILAALAETRVPAPDLELELTETVLMGATREHSDVVARLHEIGLKIAIDDFGAGFSSLAYLRRYPTDRIKIARTFIDNIETGSRDAAIVKATIGLTRELGIPVIAEGVDRRGQFDLLKAWGCPEVQGHYFADPLAVEEMTRLIQKNEPLVPGAARGERAEALADQAR
jgi:diguanylate cyclase (GGDEF)-like protein